VAAALQPALHRAGRPPSCRAASSRDSPCTQHNSTGKSEFLGQPGQLLVDDAQQFPAADLVQRVG